MLHRNYQNGAEELLPEMAAKLRLLLIDTQQNDPLLLVLAEFFGESDQVEVWQPLNDQPDRTVQVSIRDLLRGSPIEFRLGNVLHKVNARDQILLWSDQGGGAHLDLLPHTKTLGFQFWNKTLALGGVPSGSIVTRQLAQHTVALAKRVLVAAREQTAQREAEWTRYLLEREMRKPHPCHIGDLRMHYGHLLCRAGDYPNAVVTLRDVVNRGPKDHLSRLMLAESLMHCKQFAAASKHFRKLRGIDQTLDGSIVANLAICSAQSGDMSAACSLVEQALAKLPVEEHRSMLDDPDFQPLRDHAEFGKRFHDLYKNLPSSPAATSS